MKENKTPFSHIFNYAVGDGANSLVLNGLANFAMLYYVKVLGLDAKYAGLALAVTLFWDAVTDPIMGHLTDNTRSRFGRRHPYILIGGVLTALSFFFLWFVPEAFTQPKFLFWYLLMVNIVLRTASTVLIVPYAALGFEICTDYEGRSKVQSVKNALNQIVNFLGGAMAWSLFFRDRQLPDGSTQDGTSIAGNYFNMGIVLTIAAAMMIVYTVFFTRQYAVDTREMKIHNNLKSFIMDFYQIITDRYAVFVFACLGIAQLGMMLVSQVQMFTYVEFMKFTHTHKTIAHGAGMIAFALGAMLQSWLVHRIDKKPTAYVGFAACVIGNIMLYVLFIVGVLPPQTVWPTPQWLAFSGAAGIPVSVFAFAIFQGMWWGGCGILIPLATSMIADISEINKLNTGVLKDGSYSAVFSFLMKSASGVGMFLNGWLMSGIGFVSGLETQSQEVVRNMAILTFVSGPIVILLSMPLMVMYPVNRRFMMDVKARLHAQSQSAVPE
jgi:GPH family glycoside/pentoside/hexuronide:cation symporter